MNINKNIINNNYKGFTLIELLLVITIIGVLATLLAAALNNAREQSRDTRRLADINKIQQALELYYYDQGRYPPGSSLVLGDTNTKCLNPSGWQTENCPNAYIDHIPSNPLPGGMDYTYTFINASDFRIDFILEHGAGGFSAGPCRGLPAVVITCP